MRFDGPFGSISTSDFPTPPHWNRAWPQEDGRLAAIKALLNSTPDDQPAETALAAIRHVLKEGR